MPSAPSPVPVEAPAAVPVQATIDELTAEEPLAATTFVVVDLETTGGRTADSAITEIGAVKVRGGEVLGEFGTLVDPGGPVPPFIAVLTGITDAMLVGAPKPAEVLPSFLEFATGAVLVAHNAPFDTGFLKAGCAELGLPWPRFRVVDTVTLARRALMRDEVANHKLGTLAAHFRTPNQPSHRALDDARATVDVLHALLERVGSLGVRSLTDLIEFARAVSPEQRRKRHLAQGLPHAPGVYVFRDGRDRPLYVGTSGDIGTRVRGYFTASETRARMSEMIAAAERVEAIECAHPLEAEVRELRLIAAHKPPYNRRSKFPERVCWVKLTVEPYPRLSVVREVRGDEAAGAGYLGPFGSRRTAELAVAAVHEVVPLRQCSKRLSPRRPSAACVLAEIGRCPSPCTLAISVDDYGRHAELVAEAVRGDPAPLVERLLARIEAFAADQRYEEAATLRSRLAVLLRAVIRLQRLRALTGLAELVAARRNAAGGWDLAVVRRGRLAAAGASPPAAHPGPTLDALLASAETVREGVGPVPAATPEETERVLAFLEADGTRLVSVSAGWASPAAGAGRFTELLRRAEAAPSAAHDHRR